MFYIFSCFCDHNYINILSYLNISVDGQWSMVMGFVILRCKKSSFGHLNKKMLTISLISHIFTQTNLLQGKNEHWKIRFPKYCHGKKN